MPRPAFPCPALASSLLLVIAGLSPVAHADPATPFPVQLPPKAVPGAPQPAPAEPSQPTVAAPAPQPAVVAQLASDAVAPARAPQRTRAKKEAHPRLPEPALRVRVVAPSAKGMWTLHLENEGDRWLRVPADLRLLRFAIESGDTTSRRSAKLVHCAVPQALRVTSFPERNALLLGPGDEYVEPFNPRLFCFGKDAAAIAGGALVRVRYGWEGARYGARKGEPPFVVEGTTFPAAVEPKKDLVGPSMVLSYLPPDDEPEPAAREDAEEKPAGDEGAEEKPAKESVPVDEMAPRLELTGPAYIDASDAFHVTLTVKITNVGHRPAVAAIRPRMLALHVDGPDGVMRCREAAPTNALPREAFQALKPGASTSLTLIVQEACDKELFRRPGLYRLMTSLHLNEKYNDPSLIPMLGVVHAKEPTLVRIAEGPEPFYKSPPLSARMKAEKADEKAGGS